MRGSTKAFVNRKELAYASSVVKPDIEWRQYGDEFSTTLTNQSSSSTTTRITIDNDALEYMFTVSEYVRMYISLNLTGEFNIGYKSNFKVSIGIGNSGADIRIYQIYNDTNSNGIVNCDAYGGISIIYLNRIYNTYRPNNALYAVTFRDTITDNTSTWTLTDTRNLTLTLEEGRATSGSLTLKGHFEYLRYL